MTDSAIEAVFGPVPAGTDLTEDTRSGNNAVVIFLLIIATIATVLRMVARSIARAGIKSDDYVVVAALLFVYGTAGMTFAGGAYGAGTHVWTLNLLDVATIFRILFGYTFIYAAAVAATKVSILLFYYRIFRNNAGIFFNICLGCGAFLSLSYPIIVWATMASSCQPVSYFWGRFEGDTGTCIDIASFFLALGIINMINDILVLLIPIPQIWKLNMSTRKKIGVIGILTLGSFVCIASIVRIHYLGIFMNAVDVTYVMGPVFIWSSVEPSVGILGACMPTFPPLMRLVRQKVLTTTSGAADNTTGDQVSAGTPWSRRKENNGSYFVRMNEDEFQLTSYVGTGDAASDSTTVQGNVKGIVVRSQIDQSESAPNGRY